MDFSKQKIEQAKGLLAKSEGREVSEEEAIKLLETVSTLASIVLEIAEEEIRREKLLAISPNGFPFDRKGYSCLVCGGGASDEDFWYDKYGLKCMKCQQAINNKVIPASIAKNRESWYSSLELDLYFMLKPVTVRQLVKKRVLIQRVVTNSKESAHLTLFLLRDNKKTLPPKKLVKSRKINHPIDFQELNGIEPWYRFTNPFEHLKGYRILDYLDAAKLI